MHIPEYVFLSHTNPLNTSIKLCPTMVVFIGWKLPHYFAILGRKKSKGNLPNSSANGLKPVIVGKMPDYLLAGELLNWSSKASFRPSHSILPFCIPWSFSSSQGNSSLVWFNVCSVYVLSSKHVHLNDISVPNFKYDKQYFNFNCQLHQPLDAGRSVWSKIPAAGHAGRVAAQGAGLMRFGRLDLVLVTNSSNDWIEKTTIRVSGSNFVVPISDPLACHGHRGSWLWACTW